MENTFVLLITQFITVFHVTKCAGLVPKKIIQCSCSRMLCKKKIAVTKNVEPSLIYWRCKLHKSLPDHITCYCTECILHTVQVFQLLYVNLLGISYNLNWRQLCLFSYCWNIVTTDIDWNHKITVSESGCICVLGGGLLLRLLSEWKTAYWCLALIDGPNRVVLPQSNRLQHFHRMLDFNVAMDRVWLECCGNSIGDFTLNWCHTTYFESFTGEEWNLVHLLTW